MLVCVAGRGEKEKKERKRRGVKDDKRRNGDIQIFVLLFIVGDVNGALYGLPPSLLLCIVLVVVSTIFYFFSFRISLFLIEKKVIYEGTSASSGIATERDVYFCGTSKDDVFLGESLAGMTQLGS